jgi:hypothetical protein
MVVTVSGQMAAHCGFVSSATYLPTESWVWG